SANGLSASGLSANGLSANGLSANGLSVAGLSDAGLSASGLSAGVLQAVAPPPVHGSSAGVLQAKGPPANGQFAARAAGEPSWLRRPSRVFAVGLVAALAVAASVLLWPRTKGPGEPIATSAGWTGTVARVVRGSAQSSVNGASGPGSPGSAARGGVSLCERPGDATSCVAATDGASVPAGAVIRTDERSRVHLTMSDGTKLALDRGSEVAFELGDARVARLLSGAVIADVAHVEGRHATVQLPRGRVEVLGTKLVVRVSGESASVDVTRGAVEFFDDKGRSVHVHAGEEGRSFPGAAPWVSSAPRLGDALAFEDPSSDSQAARGLGELKAKKPGSDEERSMAVRLTRHHVKTRIVDGFARTEVEEVFENTTDEVLEGIYRFPLPSGAQIERLALDVDGKLEEGAYVDRDRAMAIWRGAIVNSGGKPKPREQIIWVPGPWKDPALLEQQRGGRFELRIFPIPKRGSRRVVIGYTEAVAPTGGLRRYVYPLPFDPSGSTRIDDFAVDLEVRGHDRALGVRAHGYDLTEREQGEATALSFSRQSFVPSGDLVVEFGSAAREQELTAWAFEESSVAITPQIPAKNANKPDDAGPRAGAALAASGMVAKSASPSTVGFLTLALRPKLPRADVETERAFVFIVDASRSMFGERYRRAVAIASRTVAELDPLDRITVLACDTTCRGFGGDGRVARPSGAHGFPRDDAEPRAPGAEPRAPGAEPRAPGAEFRAPGAETARVVAAFLSAITPDGGSDIAAAVAEAAQFAHKVEGRELRIVYFGDGAPTVGPIAPAMLTEAVRTSLPDGRTSLTAVSIGTDADHESLLAVARGGGGVLISDAPGRTVGELAYAVLGATYGRALRDATLSLPAGLVEISPARLDAVAPGSEVLISARMTTPDVVGTVVLSGKIGTVAYEQRYPLEVHATASRGNAFVPRTFAAQRIADLERDGSATARVNAIQLSSRFNVASRYTSLLVLESEAMFRAFGLDNDRRAPVWTGEELAMADATAEAELAAVSDERTATGDSADGDDDGRGYNSLGDSAEAAPMPVTAMPGSRSPRSADENLEDASKPKAAKRSPSGNAAVGGSQGSAGATQSTPFSSGPGMPPPSPTAGAPRPKAPLAKKSMACSSGDPLCSEDANRNSAPGYARDDCGSDRRRRGQCDMVPMRVTWERNAALVDGAIPNRASAQALRSAEDELKSAPNQRASMTKLVALYAQAGDVVRASELVDSWVAKEPLDPDALTARADLVARRGDREGAIRILGGVVDVRPGDVPALERLARLHRWQGRDSLACRYRIAAAQSRRTDAALLGNAVACARADGHSALARLLLDAADSAVQKTAESLASRPVPRDVAAGELRLELTWQGGGDLDLALINQDGRRISWLGAGTKELIHALDATHSAQETLSVQGTLAGEYLIEIVRARGEGRAHGTLTVTGPGALHRRIPFTLDGARMTLGTVRIAWQRRLVPAW
ncbi:MAG: hypothetical protein EXR75_15630, partial [Myxococcales bacterium]|nr:hypothetical protein [Myxococcales bacterium]